jgi:hypothetical protein
MGRWAGDSQAWVEEVEGMNRTLLCLQNKRDDGLRLLG